MTTYRVGNHHGVTVVRSGDGYRCGRAGHDCERGHLVGIMLTAEDAQLAVEALNDGVRLARGDGLMAHGVDYGACGNFCNRQAPCRTRKSGPHWWERPAKPHQQRAYEQPMPRIRACVEAWPECESGAYDPRCCRFPKSCSCTAYDPDQVTAEYLEDQP